MAPNIRELILGRLLYSEDQNIMVRCRHLRLLDISELKDVAEIKVEKEKTSEELALIKGSSKAEVSVLEIE